MRIVTAKSIIDKAKIKTDTVYSQHTTPAEALVLLNMAYLDLYLYMTQLDEGLFVVEQDLPAVNGEADIPDDCMHIRSVFYRAGNVDIVMDRRSIQDRRTLPGLYAYVRSPSTYHIRGNKIISETKSVPGTLKIMYVPNPQELSSVNDSIQLISSEDSYLIARLCKDIAVREESDASKWETEIMESLSKLKATIMPRDQGSNVQVRDCYAEGTSSWRGNTVRRGPYR